MAKEKLLTKFIKCNWGKSKLNQLKSKNVYSVGNTTKREKIHHRVGNSICKYCIPLRNFNHNTYSTQNPILRK